VKHQLASVPFDPATQPTLRIRHDYRPAVGVDDVVFEAATAAPAAGSTAVIELYREHWDPSIEADRIVFEIKAGTSNKEASPGTAVWDNFRVAVQPLSEP
jgi:hypothetical protein